MNNAFPGPGSELISPASVPAPAPLMAAPVYAPGPPPQTPSENSLEDYLRVLRRRWPIMVSVAAVLGLIGLGVSLKMPKEYQSTAEIYVQPPGNAVQQFGAAAAVAALFESSTGDLTTQMERMQSDQAMNDVTRRLNLHLKPEDLRKHYEIAPSKTASGMIEITGKAHTRLSAVHLVSTLIAVYKDMMSRDDASTVGRSSTYLQGLIKNAHVRKVAADARLEAYSMQNDGIVDPISDAGQYATQLSLLRTTLMSLEREMQVTQTSIAVQKKNLATLPETQVSTISFIKNPRIEADRSKISGLVQEQASLAKQYTAQDDVMKEKQAEIDAAKADMAHELLQPGVPGGDLGSLAGKDDPNDKYLITNGARILDPNREASRKELLTLSAQLEADNTEAQALQNNIQQVDATVLTEPHKVMNFGNLKADDEFITGVYTDLRAEYERLLASRSADQVYVEVNVAPLPAKSQSQPRPVLYSALAAFLGLLLGGLAMFLVDSLDPQLRDDVDIRRALRAPVLAAVPRLRATRSNPLMLNQLAAPSFRRLAYTLAFRGVGKGIRSLLVTSAVAGEGTTFTASQLALAFAREGKRVIIIDANSRNPSLHVLFGAKNNEGWIGLTRNGSHPEQALVPVTHGQSAQSPLRLIPSGSLEDHDLISIDANAEKVGELIQKLQSEADIVLVDAPAVFEGIETAMLADKVEGVLYVAGVGRVTREEIAQATDLLGNCRAPVIGVVVNAVN